MIKQKVIADQALIDEVEALNPTPPVKEICVARHIPEMVRIKFMNLRDPGRAHQFFLHTATHPCKHYKLLHGVDYDLPLEVVKHLEGMREDEPNTCMLPIRKDRMMQDGLTSESYIDSWKSNFQCKYIGKASYA